MKYAFLVILSMCCSCSSRNDVALKKILTIKNISQVLDNVCTIERSEFSELYKGNIRYESYDSFNSLLIDSLKLRGYEVVDAGWGNWEFGPRFMSFTAKRDSCECNVVKHYWADGAEMKKITESIECSLNVGKF